MSPILKSLAVSVAALSLATVAYAESAKHGSDHGSDHKVAAAESSHGAPAAHGAEKAAHGAAKTTHSKRAVGGNAHWTYTGNAGPSHWGGMSAKFAACSEGVSQSPINLTADNAAGTSAGNIHFAYNPTPVRILNNGNTIQVNYNEGSMMKVEGQTFQLLHFHFHSPSEHAINGQLADMELHMVHRNDKGELGMVGVLMNAGEENLALKEIWQHMPRGTSAEQVKNNDIINARDFLPHDAQYFRYMGSMTTPPCSEGVSWFVMAKPIEVSRQQIEQFSGVVGVNNRPVQETNNRLILSPAATN